MLLSYKDKLARGKSKMKLKFNYFRFRFIPLIRMARVKYRIHKRLNFLYNFFRLKDRLLPNFSKRKIRVVKTLKIKRKLFKVLFYKTKQNKKLFIISQTPKRFSFNFQPWKIRVKFSKGFKTNFPLWRSVTKAKGFYCDFFQQKFLNKKSYYVLFKNFAVFNIRRNVVLLKNMISFAFESNLFHLKFYRFTELTHNLTLIYRANPQFNFFRSCYSRGWSVTRKYVNLRGGKFSYEMRRFLNIKRKKVFTYSVHVVSPQKKRKKLTLFGLKTMYYRKLSFFFGFKKVSKFLNYIKCSLKSDGFNMFSYLIFLETRLETVLLRTNLFSSIYFIKKFIRGSKVFINNVTIKKPFYNLKCGEVISIDKYYYKFLYNYIKLSLSEGILPIKSRSKTFNANKFDNKDYKSRWKGSLEIKKKNIHDRRVKSILLSAPNFLEIDYKLLAICMLRNPTFNDLTKPASFNLYTQYPSIHKF